MKLIRCFPINLKDSNMTSLGKLLMEPATQTRLKDKEERLLGRCLGAIDPKAKELSLIWETLVKCLKNFLEAGNEHQRRIRGEERTYRLILKCRWNAH